MVTPNRILLVEDDAEQRLAVIDAIRSVFPIAEILEFNTGFSIVEAIRTDNLPYCEIAIIDRLLQWSQVDELILRPEIANESPPPRMRGRFVANSLSKSANCPKHIIFLSVLNDDGLGSAGAVETVYIRKSASLSEVVVALQRIRSASGNR
jgi:CheY-like chemotaxis protein